MKKEIKERIEMINNGEVPQGYKETKLGIIPGEWKIKEMGKFFDFKNGINASKEKYGSGVKFINTLEVLNNNSIYYSDIKGSVVISDKKFKKNSVQKGDILFNRTSETADEIAKSAVYLGDKEVTFGGFIIRATERKDEFDINYKKYAFNSNLMRREFKKRGQGISRINIGQNELGNVPIILLSKNEQAKIANILTTWDEAIELKEKLLEKKKDIKKGLMQNLLTGKVRLEGFDDKWKVESLGNLCTIRTGKLNANQAVENGEYPFFTCGKEILSIDKFSYNTEALLIAGNGNIGDVKYYKGKFNAYQRTYIIDNFKLDSFYIFYYMDMFFRRTVHEKEQKGAMPYIKKGFLETFKIKIPNNQVEQKSISDILSKADKSIELLEKEIELLREEKKGLMQLLLTGKVRVNEINEEILNEVN